MKNHPYIVIFESDAVKLRRMRDLLTSFPCEYSTRRIESPSLGSGDMVLCSWEAWSRKLKPAPGKRLPSYPPVVVVSATANHEDWRDVLESGGFDLVQLPDNSTSAGEFLRVLGTAIDHAARRPDPPYPFAACT